MEDKTIQVANTGITFIALVFTIIGTIYTIKSFHYAKSINENANKISSKIDTLIIHQNTINNNDNTDVGIQNQDGTVGTQIVEKDRKGDTNFGQ